MQKSILIAEDDPMMRQVLVQRLELEGYKVYAAADGDQALKFALQHHPDLIILDILMPKMNGQEVLQALRKEPWGKNAKIFMFTNMSSQEQIAKAAEYGVTDYFVKSDWSLDMLSQHIHSKLK